LLQPPLALEGSDSSVATGEVSTIIDVARLTGACDDQSLSSSHEVQEGSLPQAHVVFCGSKAVTALPNILDVAMLRDAYFGDRVKPKRIKFKFPSSVFK